MAPEVFRGHSPGSAVDIWAWGATVLFAAAGRAPFGGDALPKVMHAVLNTEPDVCSPGTRRPERSAAASPSGSPATAPRCSTGST
ncbi:hypothetical protein GCM10010191_16160 [Actinomadura vinacea]|uniref:Protein kinase domain-containing protein n=2 Tax=Actinomadura vinacea TaxID=115336 RepID=A0ABN3ILK5_9ACTN